jgi:hypothetical protein
LSGTVKDIGAGWGASGANGGQAGVRAGLLAGGAAVASGREGLAGIGSQAKKGNLGAAFVPRLGGAGGAPGRLGVLTALSGLISAGEAETLVGASAGCAAGKGNGGGLSAREGGVGRGATTAGGTCVGALGLGRGLTECACLTGCGVGTKD